MGRRKIEIKAIKDDRNRSVTFLKRKGGLFKKAHELSVLCSVDVAVIIFGSNKKLYEYSSNDIGEILQRYNYYGQPNEHKGPADFNGKKDDDDDDDEDGGSPPSHHSQEPPSMLPPQFQNQAGFQHIRHQTPSASPPISNGVPFTMQRQHTPQPQMGSRPSSRNAPRRTPSNLGQVPMTGPPPPANGYAYMQPPPGFNPANGPGIPQHPVPGQLQHAPIPHAPMQHHMQQIPMQASMQHPMQGTPPSFQFPGPPNQHNHPQQQLQVQYMEDQRRSMPPAFPQQDRIIGSPQPPQQQFPSPQPPRHFSSPQPPQLQPPSETPQVKQEHPTAAVQQQQMLQPVKRMSKSRSIFTPIDESRSILSQHWASSTSTAPPTAPDASGSKNIDALNRPSSVDIGSVARQNIAAPPPPIPPRSQTHDKSRALPGPPIPDTTFTPPSRTNSAQMVAKRPRLKVQIPDEPSPSGSGTAGSSPPGSTATGINGRGPGTEGGGSSGHSSGVVLPPPSPSAGTILSAGASGPPNPFARPHPPGPALNANQSSMKDNIETPISALPSRFMSNDFLPSPSSFFSYPGWPQGESNTLPSPLNFQTPIIGGFNSFLRDDGGGQSAGGAGGVTPAAAAAAGPTVKRKSPESEVEGAGDAKKAKIES